MNRERIGQLVEIGNSLSNDDLCFLIMALAERCEVYIGSAGGHCLTAGISEVFMNGMQVQINLESSEHDSIFEHSEFWTEGLREGLSEIEEEGGEE